MNAEQEKADGTISQSRSSKYRKQKCSDFQSLYKLIVTINAITSQIKFAELNDLTTIHINFVCLIRII